MTVVDDAATTAADASGKQVVVVSSSSNSGSVTTKFRTVAVPVVDWEAGLFDDFGMTAAAGGYVAGQRDLAIVTPGHPLAAGLSGTVSVASAAGDIAWGSPNPNAVVVARLPGTASASIFAYEAGVAMPGLTAPARRVALFMWDTTAASFTAAGNALFDAAISWATGAAAPPPPDTTPPTITTLSPTDGASGVAVTANPSATFNEPLNPATVSGSTLSLVVQGSATPLAASVSYDGPGRTAILDPSANLAAGTTYVVTVKGGASGVKDVAGNPLAADRELDVQHRRGPARPARPRCWWSATRPRWPG